MKRRESIKSIFYLSSALYLLPGCHFESFTSYSNIPLNDDQYRLIRKLIQTILPAQTDESDGLDQSRLNYVLTRLNDSYSPEEHSEYLNGLKQFEEMIQRLYAKSYQGLENDKQLSILTPNLNEETEKEDVLFFINTTRELTIENYRNTEDYLTQHLDFEFIPSRYLGCVAL